MAFTRDDLAAYEAAKVAPAVKDPPTPAVVKKPDEPVAAAADSVDDVDPALEPDPSIGDPDTDPDATGDDASAVDADSATATVDSDDETDLEVAPPAKGSARERIGELVDSNKALRKYGDHLLAHIEELKAQVAAKPAAPSTASDEPVAAAAADDEPPSMEQSGYDAAKYAKKLQEWIDKKVNERVNAAVKGATTKAQQVAAAEAASAAFNKRCETFAGTHKDFDVVLKAGKDLPALAPDAAREVILSDHGAAITYHLMKNPDLATRIARMNPQQQLKAIGSIEEKVSAPAAAPVVVKKPVTKAPAPPTPVPSGTGQVKKAPHQMSMNEFVAADRADKLAQKAARLKMRQALSR